MRAGAALLASAALTAAAPAATLEQRLASFKALGGDPLTVPVSWYQGRTSVIGGGPTRDLPVAAPQRLSARAIAAAEARAEADGADALIVVEDGRIVAERYWHGTGADTRFNPQSMAKTLVALLVGQAIDRHELHGDWDPIGRYVREWRDDPRGGITLFSLLTMTSGLAQVDAGHGLALTPDNPAVRQYFGHDFLAPMLALQRTGVAGFDYNNNNTLLLAYALEGATGVPYPRLLDERLWRPLGLARAQVFVDARGHAMASCCVFSRARDWAKIGLLIAQRGQIDGKALVSPNWIAAMTRTTPWAGVSNYGYQIWLADQRAGGTPQPPVLQPWKSEPFAADDLAFLNGYGGQRVWIVPSRKLVIVRLGRTWPKGWDDSALPNLLLRGMS